MKDGKLNKTEIKKVSREFNIPEAELFELLRPSKEDQIDKDLEKNLLKEIEIAKQEFIKAKDKNKLLTLKKWVDLSQEFDQLEEIFVYITTLAEERIVLNKWIDLCKTPRQAKNVFHNCPENSEEQNKALNKWIDLCKHLEDAREARNYTADKSPERQKVIKKITKLLME